MDQSKTAEVKGEGKRFLHGDLICNTLSEYISDGLCIISVKKLIKSHDFTYLLHNDITGWTDYVNNG